MNDITTITEEYTLPSKGLLYDKPFDPTIKLRSMTVAEEMKRLSPTKNTYKMLSEIIDDCLLTKLPVSTYDMCFGDYVYLLHKLRIVTYGPDYHIRYACPKCGTVSERVFNLDDLKVNEYSKEIEDMMTITLPVTKKTVKLRFQTPRDLDNINSKSEDRKKEFPEMEEDPRLIFTLMSFIETIDGQPLNKVLAYDILKKLPARDYNFLEKKALKLNEKVGIDIIIESPCSKCDNNVKSVFRYTDEFFRPDID